MASEEQRVGSATEMRACCAAPYNAMMSLECAITVCARPYFTYDIQCAKLYKCHSTATLVFFYIQSRMFT